MQQIETHFERALALGTDNEEAWLPQVRDWATFSLATQTDDGRELIASTLLNRVEDCDFDTRSEALVGLARRADLRVIPYLCNELCSDRVGQLAVESAKILARPELVASPKKLSKWWDVDVELLAGAIEACSVSLDETVNRADVESETYASLEDAFGEFHVNQSFHHPE